MRLLLPNYEFELGFWGECCNHPFTDSLCFSLALQPISPRKSRFIYHAREELVGDRLERKNKLKSSKSSLDLLDAWEYNDLFVSKYSIKKHNLYKTLYKIQDLV